MHADKWGIRSGSAAEEEHRRLWKNALRVEFCKSLTADALQFRLRRQEPLRLRLATVTMGLCSFLVKPLLLLRKPSKEQASKPSAVRHLQVMLEMVSSWADVFTIKLASSKRGERDVARCVSDMLSAGKGCKGNQQSPQYTPADTCTACQLGRNHLFSLQSAAATKAGWLEKRVDSQSHARPSAKSSKCSYVLVNGCALLPASARLIESLQS